jgi:transposase-like protein
MGKNRQTHSSKTKAKIALEALREQSTLAQLAAKHNVHTTQICNWKKLILDEAETLFDSKRGPQVPAQQDVDADSLLRQIGKLTMEVEFLKKKLDS